MELPAINVKEPEDVPASKNAVCEGKKVRNHLMKPDGSRMQCWSQKRTFLDDEDDGSEFPHELYKDMHEENGSEAMNEDVSPTMVASREFSRHSTQNRYVPDKADDVNWKETPIEDGGEDEIIIVKTEEEQDALTLKVSCPSM